MNIRRKICIAVLIVFLCSNFFNTEAVNALADNEKEKKIAFLTFDDGPCINNTQKIIDILKKNNIKATFFIVGQKADENPKAMKELVSSGMCIMPHTYSHEYKIFKTLNDYENDLTKCINTIEKYTGKKKFVYVRVPGGSDNLVSNRYVLRDIRNDIIKQGRYYVDWNVSSGDATAHYVPRDKIINNVKEQCTDKKIAVILMHDAYYKKTTVESLDEIIKYVKDKGYTFKTFDEISDAEKDELIRIRVINRKQKID
ncbi:polysaccharide deacetylase family protein [Clostridium hydrogenum]|uniref:polysaccharide deacetylase family protein n=1 Tax=Clostridium hydrogenum TaxID=2855764 RepID=UPI001F2F4D40|nr:polysaccharide deacetylase family protein [Clostridium hydrogenum]